MVEEISSEPGFWSRTSWIQLGYGVWVSLTMVNIGLAFNFPAVTIPQLNSAGSGIKVSLSDESWIASILTLVSAFGSLVCGYLMDKFGRKVILLVCDLPVCVGWIYTGLAPSALHIIIGRVITGLGLGMAMGAPRIFITEITLPNMRGMIGALPNLALSLGLILLAVGGVFLEWTTICFASAGFALTLFLAKLFLPETPYYTLLRKSDTDAMNSLKKFRHKKYDFDKELNEMIEFKTENNLRRLSLPGQMKLLVTKASCKPFCIIFVYMLLTQMAGVTVIFTWTVDMLQASKSSVDPNYGNVIMGVTRFCTGILSSILLYKMGRKPQALISGFGVGFTCIALGVYIHYGNEPNVIPQICYVSYVVFATIGYYTLPLLIAYEIYPLQVRGLLGGISSSLLNVLIFAVNKLYPYLRNWIGLANVILCFGVSSLLGCLFLYLYLPETKGLTLQEIEEYFNDRRSTLVSQRSVLAVQLSGSSRIDKSVSKDKQTPKHKNNPQSDVLQLKKKKKKRAFYNDRMARDSDNYSDEAELQIDSITRQSL